MTNQNTIWESLNANAASVQAIASIAALIITGVLVVVTIRYTKLTHRLAKAAEDQIEFLSTMVRHRRTELWGLIKALGMMLGELPTERQNAERMRNAPGLDNDLLLRFQELASELGHGSSTGAGLCGTFMRQIWQRVDGVKAINRETGVRWDQWPWDDYEYELAKAKEHLDVVREALKEAGRAPEPS